MLYLDLFEKREELITFFYNTGKK